MYEVIKQKFVTNHNVKPFKIDEQVWGYPYKTECLALDAAYGYARQAADDGRDLNQSPGVIWQGMDRCYQVDFPRNRTFARFFTRKRGQVYSDGAPGPKTWAKLMNNDREVLEAELRGQLKVIDDQIAAISATLKNHVGCADIYQMQNYDGSYLMVPLIQARSNVLLALSNLEK